MFYTKKINWYLLFETTEAANEVVSEGYVTTIQIGKKKICLAHTSEGFFAVNNKCPHNGASLGNGYCTKEGSVVCPIHRYHFDLKTGRAKSGGGEYVEIYPLEIRNNAIYIGFEERVWNLF